MVAAGVARQTLKFERMPLSNMPGTTIKTKPETFAYKLEVKASHILLRGLFHPT